MPEPKRISPDDIERRSVGFAIVGQVQVDQNESDDADGDVQKKDYAPMEVVDDETAGDRAEHGGDERGDGDETHDANEVRLGERSHQREAANGDHHGTAHALHDTKSNKKMDAGGDAAEKRTERKETDGGCEDAASSELVGHPAADGNEHREAERVACQHSFHAERRDTESFGDCGHRGVEDGGVERLHEERDRDQPRQQALGGVGGYRVLEWPRWGLEMKLMEVCD